MNYEILVLGLSFIEQLYLKIWEESQNFPQNHLLAKTRNYPGDLKLHC